MASLNEESTSTWFSTLLTTASGVILLAYIVWFGWSQLFEPRLDQIESPEPALARVVGRMMELKEALARAPAWERRLYEVMLTESPGDLGQAISWYEELVEYSSDPRVRVHLTILEAEAGRFDRVRQRIAGWELREEPYPAYARLIKAGYLEARSDPAPAFQAELIQALEEAWFRDRLAVRLATRVGDRALLSVTSEALAERARLLFWRVRGLAALDLAVLLIGAITLLVLLAQRRTSPTALTVGTARIPPEWRGQAGAMVLIRGGAIWVLGTMGSGIVSQGQPLLRLVVPLILVLALGLLADWYLLRPTGLGFRQALGLSPSLAGWRRLGLWVPALLAADLLGNWVLNLVAESLDLTSHWTEGLDGDLVWGTPLVLAIGLLDSALFSPVFEELAFRGLLFGTLRRKFGLGMAATLSAAIFSLWHGYGVLGSASVFWSGLLWAYAFEKTGSLLPGIVAHVVTNLTSSLEVIGLLG